ncbi:putative reverse transcriptase domain-containing protein [Tanacetum coccineum]
MSDNMPFEIQVEIMNRLPVKSLLQFRSVSKFWKCMIDSSSFVFTYSVLLLKEADKMYYDFKDRYWWPGMKGHSWAEVGEGQLIGPELVQETTKKILCGTLWEERQLAPRFVRPFEIIEKVGPVAYRLDLPEELNGVHDRFHVSNLKKCLADPTLQVPLDEIRVDDKLNFMEEHVEILEREFKKLKRSRISIIKVW